MEYRTHIVANKQIERKKMHGLILKMARQIKYLQNIGK